MTDEEREIAYKAIKEAHLQGELQRFIGDALSKRAVVIVLLDVAGAVTISADSRKSENSVRDRSMVLQMTQLLKDNMDAMMKIAGKEAKGSSG